MATQHYPIALPGARPFYTLFVPVPAVCFTGALFTDITYSRSADIMWANFSAWLLAAGEFFGALAVVVGLVELVTRRVVRAARPGTPYLVGSAVVLVIGLFNNLVHSRDAWTSVVPTGLTLSVLTVIAMLVTGVLGRTMPVRRVGAGA